MMNIRKLLTVGGDERMLYTSQSLAEKGFDVEIFAPSPPAGFEHMRPTGDKSIDSAAARCGHSAPARQPRRRSPQLKPAYIERALRHPRTRSDRFCRNDGRRAQIELFQKRYPRV